MKKLLYPVILLCQYVLISAEVKITITAKPNETEIQIRELEKTKEELLRKINGAIDDSVVALKKTNDSESAKGLQYLSELKKQIKEIDSAETDIEGSDNVTSLSAENMLKEFNITKDRIKKFRRKGKKSSIVNEDDPQLRAKKHFEFQLSGKKRKMTTFVVPDSQKKIEKDIQEWLKQRNLEKMKIRNYKEQLRAQHKETCPNFGIGKKRKGMRSRSKSKKRKNFPCCRKCCKQSYLGCL